MLVGALASNLVRLVIQSDLWPRLWSLLADRNSTQIRMTGTWKIMHDGPACDGQALDAKWQMRTELRQSGQRVTGTADAMCIDGPPKGKAVKFAASGNFANNLLDVTLTDTSRKGRNRSVFLLEVSGDGSALKGHRLFLGRETNDVRGVPCRWVRDGEAGCGTA